MAEDAARLDAFLRELRTRLRGLTGVEADEIVAELRSHVRDSAGKEPSDDAVAAVLDRLGSPADLASQYTTDRLLAQAERSPSPWLLVRSVCRWAGVSVAGGVALLGIVVGYAIAASFFAAALVKPFAPGRVGLWRLSPDELSLRLGLLASPPRGEELLGWWIVPLGLIVGAASCWLTPRFGRWAIRRFRQAPPISVP